MKQNSETPSSISPKSGIYEPLLFPILFPQGEIGWYHKVLDNNNTDEQLIDLN